jgi:YHS domain-containing protein
MSKMKLKGCADSKVYNPLPLCLILFTCISFACNQGPKKEISSPAFNTAPAGTDSAKPKFTQAMVDNKKDPSCGMPVSAGIADTVHYNGKVYGFCSDECKQIFLKNPDSLSKSAVMK